MKMKRVSWLCSILAAALIAAACGSSSSTGPSSSSTASASTGAVDQAAAALVPQAIKDQGTLIVATDPTFPPSAFFGPGQVLKGADVDLANALATTLGLEVQIEGATFDAIIPGLQAGKYTLGMSFFNVTSEREKVLDFVTYFNDGSSLLVSTQSSLPTTSTLDQMCGHSIAVQRAAVQEAQAQDQSKACSAAGKEPINVEVFNDYNATALAILTGRADAGVFDTITAVYDAQHSKGQLKVIGTPFAASPCGIVMDKSSELAPAVKAAMEVLMENGQYQQILAKWDLASGAITAPVINPSL